MACLVATAVLAPKTNKYTFVWQQLRIEALVSQYITEGSLQPEPVTEAHGSEKQALLYLVGR